MFNRCMSLLVLISTIFAGSAVLSQDVKPKPVPAAADSSAEPQEEPIDFQRAKGYLLKRNRGEKLTADEEAYLQRALAARRAQGNRNPPADRPAPPEPRDKTGLKPLTEISADDNYQGEDGGLYGHGENRPPAEHQAAAETAIASLNPLDKEGQPADDGVIGFISISMSNATQEFSRFKQIADADPDKNRQLKIVDCAQGGQAMAEWVDPQGSPWRELERRLDAAGVTDEQVQMVWLKLANKGPHGDLAEHGGKLKQDTLAVIHNVQARFPNVRLAYLSSRIYAGYAAIGLNPEPYAYESAFVVRWLIQDQIAGKPELNHSAKAGKVAAPILLWGPYLWADGVQPRKSDQLVYTREDLAGDGTHPSGAGREKVARVMLEFYKTNPLAKEWFLQK